MQDRLIPISFGWHWVSKAWNIFKKDKIGLFSMSFLFVIITTVSAFFPIVGAPASGFLSPFLIAGFIQALKNMESTGKINVGDLFNVLSESTRFRAMFPLGVTTAILTAGNAVIVSMLVIMLKNGNYALPLFIGGMTSLVIYSATFTILTYAPALVDQQKTPALAAMETSLILSLKNWLPFLMIGLIYFLLVIAAICTLGLGLLILMPLVNCLPYLVYQETFPPAPETPSIPTT